MTDLPPSPWRVALARLTAITPETPGVHTYDLTFESGAEVAYRFRPGQFNMLYVPGVGEAAISVSSDPAEPARLRHTIRTVGNVTRALTRLRVGDQIGVRGPFGTAWPVENCRGRDVLIVAGGLGLAPLRPVVYHLLRHRADASRVTLIYGCRTPADLLYAAEYDAWRAGGIDVHLTVNFGDGGWTGSIGTVTPLVERLPLRADQTVVFTCGPEVMMRFVGETLVGRGVPAPAIYVSLERNMNCAVGLCGHCQFGPALVCRDGPVFPLDRVRRLMLVEDF